MDVLCYWKNHDADMKAGRIGHFKSTPDKLKEFADGYPDFLWVFNTPKGRKGEVQLLARLKWTDRPTVRHKPEPGTVAIHYDPHDLMSVSFGSGGSDAAIAATSRWMGGHFPKMAAAHFIGASGQEAVRGSVLKELQQLAASMDAQPFMTSEEPGA
ncbi:hypothetical protein [Ideonella sp. A 288]|uniref:hypothetical protein n=1 Tax=Ideonella sp. A 288 TaxID=1962181 RepID=UPI000B4B0D49|nr:hypothetical protein [Ideonella sp. A 288]